MLSPYLASATSVSVCCSDGVSLCYTLCYTLCHRTCLKFSLSVGVCSRALLLANNFSGCVSFSLPSSAMWERLQSFINNKHHSRLSVILESGHPTLSATPAQASRREAQKAYLLICPFQYLLSIFAVFFQHLILLSRQVSFVIIELDHPKVFPFPGLFAASAQGHSIVKPRCCLTANDFQFGRLVGNYTLTPLSYKFMPNTAISHSICTSMFDSQTPFLARLPNMQSGSRGCSFPKLPGPDGHPLL
ncbi:hypothetical protein J3E68DRAFT_233589 [Trichoderma sp. SZMC 28012]